MTTIQHGTRGHPIRLGLSGLIISVVMIGIGVGATFAVMGGVLDNLDSMAGSNKVIVESVNAYTNGDRMVITGNIKNIGTTAMTSVLISEISAGDLVITQNPITEDGDIPAGHGSMDLAGLGGDATGTVIATTTVDVDTDVAAIGTLTANFVNHGAAITADDGAKFVFGPAATGSSAMVDVIGLSTDEGTLESLPAGAAKSFRITITGVSVGSSAATVLDILRTVPAGAEMILTIAGTDGQSSTISDPRTTRVNAR